jgi:hypothetical protein
MANANNILPGTQVRTWDGSIGTVLYFRAGWYGLRTEDGLLSEWQPDQIEQPEVVEAA